MSFVRARASTAIERILILYLLELLSLIFKKKQNNFSPGNFHLYMCQHKCVGAYTHILSTLQEKLKILNPGAAEWSCMAAPIALVTGAKLFRTIVSVFNIQVENIGIFS